MKNTNGRNPSSRSTLAAARLSLLAVGAAIATLSTGCQLEYPDGVEGPLGFEDELYFDEGEGEIAGLEQAMRQTGAATFVGCSGQNLTIAQNAFNIVRDRIWNGNSQLEFHACLKEATYTSSFAFPELLLNILREDVTTTITCRSGKSGNGNPETIFLGSADFATAIANSQKPELNFRPPENTIADVLIHELVHTKGRLVLPLGTGHEGPATGDLNGRCAQGCIERQMSITSLVSSCLFDGYPMDNPFPEQPAAFHIPNRTDMGVLTGEVVTSPAGVSIDMNAPAENHCQTSEVGVGLTGRSSGLLDKLGMVCRSSAGEFTNFPTGGNGGTAFDSRCPANEVMIGVKGRANMTLNSIGPICALSSSVASGGSATSVTLPTFGGTGGFQFQRRCPAFEVVKGIRIRHSGTIQRIDVVCQQFNQLRNIGTTGTTRLGGTGGTRLADEHCPSMSVVDILWGVAEDGTNFLNRLGAGCTRVSNTVAGGPITEHNGPSDNHHMTPFHGFQQVEDTGFARNSGCGPGSLIVGMKAWSSNDTIRAVQGVCATNANLWSAGTSVSTFNTSQIGTPPAGATLATFTCPLGRFVTGWRIAEDPNIMSITPRCRIF